MEAPEQLRITWARGGEFLDAFDPRAGRYAIAVPHGYRVLQRTTVGAELVVELAFLDTQRSFRHRARVAGHLAGPPEIVTLQFLADQTAVRDLIVCHAEGTSIPYLNRRAERRAVWLPIEVRTADGWRRGIITELSELGAFIAMQAPPGAGMVRIRIGRELEVDGRVLYVRAEQTAGCAVEFVFPQRDEEIRIQAVLRAALQTTNR
ncbi:MAG: PilZ domain-containing protein [Myxococcota bacterium]|nr:PilZ domain-containing protein [Myxococcota bacterium]